MRDVAGLAALQAIEILLPFGVDAVGRDQVLLVEVFDERAIGAELGGLGELLEETVHGVASNLSVGWGVRPRRCWRQTGRDKF